MSGNREILDLTVRELLSQGKYHIPIYQRNYDWGERESLQLLEDIADYASREKENNYYIGSLVVYLRSKNGEDYFETIDGQQRLTTLTIMMCALCSLSSEDEEVKYKIGWFKEANISYDHRPEADEAISNLVKQSERRTSDHSAAVSIYDVYNIMKKNISSVVQDKSLTLSDFVDYLLNSVIIIRVPVPENTELNHYFEIMNSRGEQLEKHEVLKANLMSNLDKRGAAMQLFNNLWEACSDMTKYVQMGISTNLRDAIFSTEWDKLLFDDFDELLTKYPPTENTDLQEGTNDCTLEKLFEDAKKNIKYNLPSDDNDPEGGNERFGSVINFPNFLLQTLKVMYRNESNYDEDINKSITLDDKQLIGIFQQVLNKYDGDERCNFSKRFIMALLRMRLLFDKYVIKRETYNNREGWSLKSLKKYDKSKVNYVVTFPENVGNNANEEENNLGKDIRMLEAMFHVSAPTQVYKHWLNAILYYLNKKEGPNLAVDANDMRRHLYQLACAYMRDQYLITKDKIDFETIIYQYNSVPQHRNDSDIDWGLINCGCNVKNFIFNFYDYIVWKADSKEKNPKYRAFDFTYRTSVEHFYPQTPQRGFESLAPEYLNSFGNLCLISRGMNSKFSNNMPEAKVNNFGNDETLKELSIKLIEMMAIVKEKKTWNKNEIEDFRDKAEKRLLAALNQENIEDEEEYNTTQN